ncbi:GNAT family N-acetyltransferase [Ornithinicoccus halotolerans]|uniref:GNAT family N-acetyltransferase n=1 Tax=Ornithinicoccus halotolerans TaxID=1748220 RepID=UPI0012959119|nr:DUF4081 domain-containing GNAT family N-acetyltransferase [Ornithinicoccus halotolerans]
MLQASSPVRTLRAGDRTRALEVCAQDPVSNVFVAARILEGGFGRGGAALLDYHDGDRTALCWASANVVPVECDPAAAAAFADRVADRRRWTSSLFGPAEPVLAMWERLRPSWGEAREVRASQPVLTTREPGPVEPDPRVRPATPEEVDLVLPAAAAMFTEEIGYPPYHGSGASYRRGVAHLVQQGRTLVRTEGGEVIFKADLGSVALGVAQVQGVWVHPELRGQRLAAPAMAAVVQHALRHVAPTVTLYVNDFNAPALATYQRVGFRRTGTFTTVLL